MDLGLDKKVALVAGGSSGFGLAIAKEFAREGAHVAIGARNLARLDAARHELEEVANGGRVLTTSVDVTDRLAARRWVDDAAAEFGALHTVVVSGGSPMFGSASQFDVDGYQAAVEQVLYPAIGLALAALPHMRSARWGRLLFVGSETAIAPNATLALSGVTRAGLVRFIQGLAADVGRDGITVNMLAPGASHTPPVERMAAQLTPDGDVEAGLRIMGAKNALGRVGKPEEIGAFAAFLASERGAFITGGVHLIDGGASLGEHAQAYDPHTHPSHYE